MSTSRSAALLLLLTSCGDSQVSYETPSFELVDRIGELEVRRYEPYLVAETVVEGDLESAGNQGFRILAKYIFGQNQGSKKIPMTSPVSQAVSTGEKIAMTAPVSQTQAGDDFTVQFMMPSQYTRESLPAPLDSRIRIREVPARTFAVVRYSGTWSRKNYMKHLGKLRSALRANGFEPEGEPVWARYNSPFTPWFLRRNEIMIAFKPLSA